jgi:hypothetical protein
LGWLLHFAAELLSERFISRKGYKMVDTNPYNYISYSANTLEWVKQGRVRDPQEARDKVAEAQVHAILGVAVAAARLMTAIEKQHS